MTKETITIELPCDQAVDIYRFCSEHRITLDELVEQFMMWCIREPDAFSQWFETNKSLFNECHGSIRRAPRLVMPEITEEELLAHWDENDFLLAYGNPILIRSKDGQSDCVLMSIVYYNRIRSSIKELEERIKQIGSDQ